MSRIPFIGLGSLGILADPQPTDLPPEAWSDGRNVQMSPYGVIAYKGHASMGVPPQAPIFCAAVQTPATYYWIVASATRVYALYSGAYTDLYPPGFHATERWQHTIFNGVPIFNNGVDAPFFWPQASISSPLQSLPAWGAGWVCRNISAFKSFLVTLAPTKANVQYPHDVFWSSQADPGTLPATWDIADPTQSAGQVSLADSQGECIDQLVMGDMNIVYKEDATYSMRFVGGQDIFAFRKLFNIGPLAAGCVDRFIWQGEKHVFIATDNIYVHDGNYVYPILTNKMKKWFYLQIDASNFNLCFVQANPSENEVWFCFPEVGAAACTKALTWNYASGTFGTRDLPGVRDADIGIVNISGDISPDSWAGDSSAWDTDSSAWGERNYRPAESHLVLASLSEGNLYATGYGTQFNGANFPVWIERQGLTITGQDRKGQPIYNSDSYKLVNEVYPRVKGPSGATLFVRVGSQDVEDGPINWSSRFPFMIGYDRKVNCGTSGRIIGIRFESDGGFLWELHGYDLELKVLGKY